MSDMVFLFDEGLAELVTELRDGIATGRMKRTDAIDILTKAIKRLFEEKGASVSKDQTNN